MKREEFLKRLSALLSDLPETERREALQYYEDYLNDAGVEEQGEVLEVLGTPEALAASIREGLNDPEGRKGEFSEHGFRETEKRAENEMTLRSQGQDAGGQKVEEPAGRKARRSGSSVLLWVLLGLLLLPFLLPVVMAVLTAGVVLVSVAIALTVGFLALGIVCVVLGVLALFSSFGEFAVSPAGAMVAGGLSLMLIGLGILLTVALAVLTGRVILPAFRKLVGAAGSFFHRGEGRRV